MSAPAKREPWWTWRWDRLDVADVPVRYAVTRWRRGAFLTVYRMRTATNEQWWFYGPFNLAFGFSFPRSRRP